MTGITPTQQKAVAKAISLRLPFALYAYPSEAEFHFVASKTPGTTWEKVNGPAFLLGEFAGKPGQWAAIPEELDADALLKLDSVPQQPRCLVQPLEEDTDELDYLAMLYAVVHDLRNRLDFLGQHGKVVISRIKHLTSPGVDSLLQVAQNYFEKLPYTFRYIAYHHSTGLWLGATPEVVADYSPETHLLQTEALAGTLFAPQERWDWKNREEQRMVKDYILQVLSKHKARIIGGKNKLKTVQKRFGDLRHLWTPITATLDPREVIPLLTELAPTPAVGGFPRDYAIETILRQELHMRRCYGGCVGVVARDMHLHLYANLRSALAVFDAEKDVWDYNLYVGGGITAHSSPSLEYTETFAKALPFCIAVEKVNPPRTGVKNKD